jgi:hypothetical protein
VVVVSFGRDLVYGALPEKATIYAMGAGPFHLILLGGMPGVGLLLELETASRGLIRKGGIVVRIITLTPVLMYLVKYGISTRIRIEKLVGARQTKPLHSSTCLGRSNL